MLCNPERTAGVVNTHLTPVSDFVTFADGHESDAQLIGAQPENDLAVLRALKPPAELEAATMRSTAAGLIAATHRPPSEAKHFCGAK